MSDYLKPKDFTFRQGDVVTVKGKQGKHRVSYCLKIPSPAIDDKFQFTLKDVEMVKFLDSNGRTDFYAYASDVEKVK